MSICRIFEPIHGLSTLASRRNARPRFFFDLSLSRVRLCWLFGRATRQGGIVRISSNPLRGLGCHMIDKVGTHGGACKPCAGLTEQGHSEFPPELILASQYTPVSTLHGTLGNGCISRTGNDPATLVKGCENIPSMAVTYHLGKQTSSSTKNDFKY